MARIPDASVRRPRCSNTRVLLLAVLLASACGTSESPPGPRRERASQLVTGTAESAEYVYDGAGNIQQIRVPLAGTVSIAGFVPARGGAGQVVTVSGSGFSPIASANAARLGGTPVTVAAATYSELTFVVPAGSGTGRISVSVGSGTAASASDFTVIAGVEVSDFSPKLGRAGTILTVTGANFGSTPGANLVSIGGGSVSVTSASPNTLLATVGSGSTSGKVRVTVGPSIGTSASDFYMLPGNASPWDVVSTARAQPGINTSVAVGSPGKMGLALFDGVQGAYLTINVTGVTFPGSTLVTVYAPGGTALIAASVTFNTSRKLELPALPTTGTYTVSIQPTAPSTGKLDLQVLEEATASLSIDGPSVGLVLAPGQNGRYTFSGAAGDVISFAATSLTTTPAGAGVGFTFNKPDGTWFYNYTFYSPTAVPQLPYTLPTTGTYTLRVLPGGTGATTATVLLSRPITGTLATNGTVTRFQSARAGQIGTYTFSGTAGQGWTLRATADATFTGSVAVYQPNGASLASGALSASSDVKVDLGLLPATGTYKVVVTPSGLSTGAVDLRLVAEAVGTLTIGATAKTLSLTAAQNGRYTFSGTAGDVVSFAATSLTTTPAGSGVGFTFNKPDGTWFYGFTFYSPTAVPQLPYTLPTTGTYTLRVLPAGTGATTAVVLLSKPITGTLATNGTVTRFQSARAGQTGSYTFSGTTGKGWTLRATAGATFTGNVTVYQPNGASLASGALSANSDVKVDLGLLPATGTYKVVVMPSGLSTGAVDLRLVAEAVGTLTIGATAKSLSLTAAQNGRYTFSGTSGDLLSVAITALSTAPAGGYVAFIVLKPDGSSLSWNGSAVPASWPLPTLPTTGTYTLRIAPPGAASATIGVAVTRR